MLDESNREKMSKEIKKLTEGEIPAKKIADILFEKLMG